ncbi:hypothetical protein AAUPMC_21146, partial [Pasteurella multocida subsp. multocida str. Anand1_cattle]
TRLGKRLNANEKGERTVTTSGQIIAKLCKFDRREKRLKA